MAINQLVLFWRDAQARCFTAWHFQPAPRERASHRAYEILEAVRELTTLQIYGAILDTTPLRLATPQPAPPYGTNSRLQVSLRPQAPQQVGGGQLKFSIPGPTATLCHLVSTQQFTAQQWQVLEQEVILYLCSPKGVQVSVAPDHLLQAEIVDLSEEHHPKPGETPLSAALIHTEEALATASRSYQQLQTPKVLARVEKYQTRLALLQQWQQREEEFFEQVSPSQPALAVTALVAAVAAPQSESKREKSLQMEVPMSLLPPTPNVSTVSLFVPLPPTGEEIATWQDVPAAHFASPQHWVHRTQLREWFNLNERTYYRWINEMKEYGLSRSLPAEGNARVALFYLKDIEQAVARAQAANSREFRPRQVAVPTTAPDRPPAPAPDLLTAQMGAIMRELAALRQQQQTLAQSITRLETTLAEQRQADLDQLQQQLNKLAGQQAAITAQLPQGQLLDLIAQLVSLNQLPTLLRQLNNNVKKLTPPTEKKAPTKRAQKAQKKRRG